MLAEAPVTLVEAVRLPMVWFALVRSRVAMLVPVVAAVPTVTALVRGRALSTEGAMKPAMMLVGPVKLLLPPRVRVPRPTLVRVRALALLVMTPLKVLLALVATSVALMPPTTRVAAAPESVIKPLPAICWLIWPKALRS